MLSGKSEVGKILKWCIGCRVVQLKIGGYVFIKLGRV
jgi:hypothetical protein